MQKTHRKKGKGKKKTHKKQHSTGKQLFILLLCLLLIAMVVGYIYRHEIREKLSEHSKPQQTETVSREPAKTAEPSPSKQKKEKKKPAQPLTATTVQKVKAITDYADLTHVVSTATRHEQIIFHSGHTLSYNKEWKIPNWVAYEHTAVKTLGDAKRESTFYPDPKVSEGSATTADYRRSGYDRGHMAPAADMKWSSTAMRESFYLSNVCPQHPQLNQKKWKELEDKVRQWAVADSAIIVICGPIVTDITQQIGNNVVVPQQFFKVILSPYTNSPKAIGFLFDNVSCSKPLRNYAVSIDSVESVTRLDFFSSLPDDIEEILEAVVDTLYWGI